VSAVKATPDFSIFPDAPTNEWDLYVTVKMPAMTNTGSTPVTIASGSKSVSFDFMVVLPCNLKAFCGTQQLALGGMILNPFALGNAPPVDEACSLDYCIMKDSVPFPTILSKPETSGLTSGGDTYKVLLADFMALSVSDASVTVVMGDNKGFATILDFSTTDWTAPPVNVLANRASLSFKMPAAPLGEGAATVFLTATFGSETRAVSFPYKYTKPISGRAVVNILRPSSLRTGRHKSVSIFPPIPTIT
jgi:hypothetical protein